ncbi:LytR C-terminal domain-containing protein [Actinoplanes sp. GCM10030250]|uniref:LytR C-terminal domain-containing protein n=1 Tax=Actinoplanes sp. GCM10030250 TaxID=3273376 RepID=UPI003618840C
MSRSVREQILDLETDVQQLRLAPAAAVRQRGQRRRRRHIAVTASSLVLVAAAAGFALTNTAQDRLPAVGAAGPGSSAEPGTVDGTRCGPSGIPLNLQLPDGPEAVSVRVFNGATPTGLDQTVTLQLRQRAFTRAESAGTATVALKDKVGTLRYGPRALGSAALLRAYFADEVVSQFDPALDGETVELVVGPDFRQLATPTEINQALVEMGPVTVPREC